MRRWWPTLKKNFPHNGHGQSFSRGCDPLPPHPRSPPPPLPQRTPPAAAAAVAMAFAAAAATAIAFAVPPFLWLLLNLAESISSCRRVSRPSSFSPQTGFLWRCALSRPKLNLQTGQWWRRLESASAATPVPVPDDATATCCCCCFCTFAGLSLLSRFSSSARRGTLPEEGKLVADPPPLPMPSDGETAGPANEPDAEEEEAGDADRRVGGGLSGTTLTCHAAQVASVPKAAAKQIKRKAKRKRKEENVLLREKNTSRRDRLQSVCLLSSILTNNYNTYTWYN